MNNISEPLEQLSKRIETLEHRVSALEQSRPPLPTPAAPLQQSGTAAAPAPRLPHTAGIFSVLGKALLAVAGAYLLRALAASSALPRLPVLALAIGYAFLWLLPAARAKGRLPSTAWACASALILLPMLWESIVRFNFLTDSAGAAVLAAFAIFSTALAWKHHFAEVAGVAHAAAALAAVALAIAVHALIPILSALLVVALSAEVAAARHRTLRIRPLVAAAADFLVFALIWIYSSPAAARAAYPELSAALILTFASLLLFIYGASASTQSLLLGRPVSFFETAQTLVAFLLAVRAVFVFAGGPGVRALGIVCLIAAAAGYVVAFTAFERAPSRRNFHVYASGSLALLLAGCWLSLSALWISLILAALAVAATLLGVRTARRTLEFHGFALLLAAAFSSGLLLWALRALAARFPASPVWPMGLVALAAILGYLAIVRDHHDCSRSLRLLRLLHAALAWSTAAALLVWELVIAFAGTAPPAGHLALLRTFTGCALTLLLAWIGSRQHRELVWLAWTSLTCIAGKLLVEDLRHGHLGFTAASIFVYALALLLVPRLARVRQDATLPR